MPVEPADERRHSPGPGDWEESWSFDFWTPDAGLGGSLRLALRPGERRAWFWACLVRPRQPLVIVRDHDVDPPRGRALEVRAEGLWTDFVCETPLEHWTIGLEAFAVALDDPLEAYRGERGDRMALGVDLEWEGEAACSPHPALDGYEQPCLVSGEILVGDERLEVSGHGWREHGWGDRRWWDRPWHHLAGRLEDGTALSVGGPVVGTDGATLHSDLDPEGLPLAARAELGGLAVDVVPRAMAPFAIPAADGRVSRLARALCRLQSGDGRSGAGWGSWLQPRALRDV